MRSLPGKPRLSKVSFPAALAALALAALGGSCSRSDRSSRDGARTSTAAVSDSASAPTVVAPEMAPAPPPAGFQISRGAREEAAFAGRGVAGGAAGGVVRDKDLANAPGVSVGTAITSAGAQQPSGDVLAPAMIIRSGQVVVEVDSLDRAVARVRQIAAQFGGYVANTSFSGGDNQVRGATLELKLPAARFDEALAGLRPIGKVEMENVAAQDVGEEFVDVTARVTNARRLEQRLIDLLARRTGKLEDVLAVERELARVREEIERYEGRLRYLRTRSAVSTLAVTVHEPRPVLASQPGVNPIAEAFRDAWRNFVALTAGVIASMGVLIPLGVVAALAWWAWRKYGRSARLPEPEREPAR
jgi:hypothetical protein